jgi:hypothetical protein
VHGRDLMRQQILRKQQDYLDATGKDLRKAVGMQLMLYFKIAIPIFLKKQMTLLNR